ncbi:MAG: right-handed parallel beta-helix repeat-containing protein [Bacteroidetes bacterium]|nr:right-handed parallel beta-helix repeat-containing protein [Bacteroidota bacterium]
MKYRFVLLQMVGWFILGACTSLTDEPFIDSTDLTGFSLQKSQDSLILKPGQSEQTGSNLTVSDSEFLIKLVSSVQPASSTLKLQNLNVLITSPSGIRLPSNINLDLSGTTITVSPEIRQDGNVFWGRNVKNVRIMNGQINGNRDQLPDHVNIAGIVITGASSDIRVTGTSFSNLSSNGIRVMGTSESQPISNVNIQNCVFLNTCNKYNDYLEPNVGPVKGTTRDDQGAVKFSFVNQFQVRDCRLSGSKSDGTHFFRSNYGEISQNTIIDNKMGGLFLETCVGITASRNTIMGNGSRGITVERGSADIQITDNLVSSSGREGIWIDDTKNMMVSGNSFRLNGRKGDTDRTYHIKFTDTSWPQLASMPKTTNVTVTKNKFLTDRIQVHAIQISSACRDISINSNEFRGDIRSIRPDCYISGVGSVTLSGNDGWVTENSGRIRLLALTGKQTVEVPHGLQVFDPANPQIQKQLVVEVKTVRPVSDPSAIRFTVKSDLQKLVFSDIFISEKLNLSSELVWTATLVSK